MKRLFKIGVDRHDPGRVITSWHPDGNLIASAGKNGIVHLTNRHGDFFDQIALSSKSPILALEWDRKGEMLAILQDNVNSVALWSLSSKSITVSLDVKEPTFLSWSKLESQLAIGNTKGSLLIYHNRSKIPVVGKHNGKILCGNWSNIDNSLVLGSSDGSITISNSKGETMVQTEHQISPLQVQFHSITRLQGHRDNMISSNLNGKSLLLYSYMSPDEEPLELTFAQRDDGPGCRYGDIIGHEWIDNMVLLLAFSGGYLVAVSTDANDLGSEKFCLHIHREMMSSFAYNPILKRIATGGPDGVRIVNSRDFTEIPDMYIPVDTLENGRLANVQWSPDGEILTASTHSGNVYTFLAKVSTLSASYKSTIAVLSSLREVTVTDCSKRSKPIDVTLRLEPSILAVGTRHVAAGMNNRIYYHRIGSSDMDNVVAEKEYVGNVVDVQLNGSFAVVLTDTKAFLHSIEVDSNGERESRIYPEREEGPSGRVTCVSLTDNFLFYGTAAGTVEAVFLGKLALLTGIELRLKNPAKKIFPNATGTRLVVVDSTGGLFLYNPVHNGGSSSIGSNTLTEFESPPSTVVRVLWDLVERHVIMIFDGSSLHTYTYIQNSVKGPLLVKLGPITVSSIGEVSLRPDKTEIPASFTPMASHSGSITCQSSTGELSTVIHPYFSQLESNRKNNRRNQNNRYDEPLSREEELELRTNQFCQCLALNKLDKAWELAVDLNKRSFYLALSNKAMELLNVELAYLVYNQLGDAAMTMALSDCMAIEDRNLLAGQVSLLFCDYQRAQDLFLMSSRPIAALEMRKDLLQWEQSLKLAQILAPAQVPEICIRYGQSLEVRDSTDQALRMFENALDAIDNDGNRVISDELVPSAEAGIARCQLRLGNLGQGIRLANHLDEKSLYAECAAILEQQKQYSEAANMFVKADDYERAAAINLKYLLIKDKSRITATAAIMEHVQSDALNSAYGKLCKEAGMYEEALRAYKRTNDVRSVVEIQLRYTNQVQQAFDLIRSQPSAAGADLVAAYCLEQNDFRGAIEFTLLANKTKEAFNLAQTHKQLELFTGFLGDAISNEDALRVATVYEQAGDYGRAGKFLARAGQNERALSMFFQCGDREIDAAIELIGRVNSDHLTSELVDFLNGERDGLVKDARHIYKLYLALKKFDKAAKTALIMCRDEQELGNYGEAHRTVCEMIRHLEEASVRVPQQLRSSFVLLHSYHLVKLAVQRGDHLLAARLLLRVAQNHSKFPKHVVPILTSTVIECQRAGLKASSYTYATMLVHPDYRSSLPPQLKQKIEAIVRRRSAHTEEAEEERSLCPLSNQYIPITQLECPTTRDALPMCVVTGKHMVLDDWTFCPISHFPALYTEYVTYIRSESARMASENTDNNEDDKLFSESEPSALDPIFGQKVSVSQLTLVSKEEALTYIQRYNNVLEKAPNADTKEAEAVAEPTVEGNEGDTEEATKPLKNPSPSKSFRRVGKGNNSMTARMRQDRINQARRMKRKLQHS